MSVKKIAECLSKSACKGSAEEMKRVQFHVINSTEFSGRKLVGLNFDNCCRNSIAVAVGDNPQSPKLRCLRARAEPQLHNPAISALPREYCWLTSAAQRGL